jgi:hypothetical protein
MMVSQYVIMKQLPLFIVFALVLVMGIAIL